ncbi:16S rRNA (guanine(527)-N(7))-methyltransferase RsmG [Ramlibacter aquaticus]|uniref:Ribosomal RNA small subunit methyltransferase G n=2 Tax=Comamonadaceae TaxID=80864 RepID=A0ABR9SFA4_9BURK|nr:16S rRNA (guanine(527)-N(7))-methyltransferase RsmG [Ramlibacter aquaticus]
MAFDMRAGLLAGAHSLGLDLDERQADQLVAYAELLQKWSKAYNLTALRTPEEILTHHLLDSLSVVGPVLRHAQGRALRIMDTGSGAGLPGVVLAVCVPGVQVDCVDTVAKKAAFVQQVAGALRIPTLRGVHARAESLAGPYDLVTSRAFASLADFVAVTAQALASEGVWMAMKGKSPDAERAALPPEVTVFHVEQLVVPGLDAERCLVWMRRA